MPLISVIMPMYNAENFVKTAIDSVLAQSEKDFELIIVDDASADDSVNVVSSICDPRIKLIRLDVNSTAVKAANTAIGFTTSKFIARMDADDIAMPKRFEVQLAFLRENEKCVIVGSSAKPFFEGGGRAWKYPANFGECRAKAMFNSPLLQPTTMMRSWLFNHISYKKALVEDYDLMLQALEYGELFSLPQVMLKYRIHKKSLSHANVDKQFGASNELHKIELTKLGNFSDEEVNLHTKIARYEASGSLEGVREHLQKVYKLGADKYAPKKAMKEICDFFYAEAFLASREPIKNYKENIKPLTVARYFKNLIKG